MRSEAPRGARGFAPGSAEGCRFLPGGDPVWRAPGPSAGIWPWPSRCAAKLGWLLMGDVLLLARASAGPVPWRGERRGGKAWVLAALVLALAVSASPGRTAPLSRDAVPEPLQPWVDWVLSGHESETCPSRVGDETRTCVWPARLELRLDERGGSFEQVFFAEVESVVRLPGDTRTWPESVEVDGRPAAVFPAKGQPSARLAPGRHRVRGRFVWADLPQVLRIPPQTGLVELWLRGEAVPFPTRDAQGRLWLRGSRATNAGAEDRLSLQIHRHLVDEIPVVLTTEVRLQVAGASREAWLGPVLPEGFVPLSLQSPLPARIEPDGRLRIQVRPGRWRLRVRARHVGPVTAIQLPPTGERWAASEVWVFEARPALRLVEVEGVTPVDPTQTELPSEWRRLPAYRVGPGESLRLVEKRRGSAGPLRDELHLARTWHLDFDGGGATVHDVLRGTIRSQARLEMGEATRLGRAAVNGVDQPITRRATEGPAGLEVPLGSLHVDADSRVEGGVRRLPAVGWDRDLASLEATLQLPPGWRLIHVSGADRAHPTWIGDWTLLDLFLVLVTAMAFFRLFGPAVGGLAAVTLALTYTEPGSPGMLWLAVLAAEALRRVVPAGRFTPLVVALRAGSLVALVLVVVPFCLEQLRAGLYPALERPGVSIAPAAEDKVAVERPVSESPGELQEEATPDTGILEGKPERMLSAKGGLSAALRARPGLEVLPAGRSPGFAPDPRARIPTGPGRPEWRWEQVTLQWSGPVERSQHLGLWLVPPSGNTLLALLRTGLLLVLALVLLRAARDLGSRWLSRRREGQGSATTTARLFLGIGVGVSLALPSPVSAELPSKQLLEELRARLLEDPACHPSCAAIPRLVLGVGPGGLELRLTVEVEAGTAVPLPGGGLAGQDFVATTVRVDGAPAEALSRGTDGRLWLRLPPGRFRVELLGALPPRETIELPLPLRPRRVELGPTEGWEVQGVHKDGSSEPALQLVRERSEEPAGGSRLEQTAIPPFVRVVRHLDLGLRWEVSTNVERIAPSEAAIVLEVPLLPGESVTTAGVRVREGRALVGLGPGRRAMSWSSELPATDVLHLRAPEGVAWTEVWQVAVGPVWHVEPRGIPWVEAPARGAPREREWRPWPGEELVLEIERPEGVDAPTVTADGSRLSLDPGLRATDATLILRLRSSQGAQHRVRLPEGAELTRLQVDGRDLPLRQEGRDVPLALVPGSQTVMLGWRAPAGMALCTRAPEIDLGLPSVNHHVQIQVPPSRWVIWTAGPRLGPAVLFWPIVVLLAVLAFGLGRLRQTPLRAHHWFLLGIGLSQAPLVAAGSVVIWVLALAWRRQAGAGISRAGAFDGLQVGLVLLTGVALFALFASIQQGLLGLPEMQIGGNGSGAGVLRWYQDRVAAQLPQPWVLSLPLWVYRVAMLAWSLWLARALVGWLRWGWGCFGEGGLWRPLRSRVERPGPDGGL